MTDGDDGSNYVVCRGCGLLQEGKDGLCGVCEAPLEHSTLAPLPGLAVCSLELGLQLQDQMVDEHWRWKTMWSEALKKVAVGAEEGEAHGNLLEFLEEQVKIKNVNLPPGEMLLVPMPSCRRTRCPWLRSEGTCPYGRRP